MVLKTASEHTKLAIEDEFRLHRQVTAALAKHVVEVRHDSIPFAIPACCTVHSLLLPFC